jgi:HAMP domain-containing protein
MIALFAEAPALPLHTAGPYVAAAYIVFLLVVLVYVWIMARKLNRNSRELRDLRAQIEERDRDLDPDEAVSVFPSAPQNDNESHSQFGPTDEGASTGGAEVL